MFTGNLFQFWGQIKKVLYYIPRWAKYLSFGLLPAINIAIAMGLFFFAVLPSAIYNYQWAFRLLHFRPLPKVNTETYDSSKKKHGGFTYKQFYFFCIINWEYLI